MGTDIHGWVEARYPWLSGDWYGVIQAGAILFRNYNAFGSLFGVRNGVDFGPIAAGRGIPPDASEDVIRDTTLPPDVHEICCHSQTFITWEEIQAIDWDEWVLEARVHLYETDRVTGEWGSCRSYGADVPEDKQIAETWIADDKLLLVRRLSPRDALDADFVTLFGLMERLAQWQGKENVRLVVWFDN